MKNSIPILASMLAFVLLFLTTVSGGRAAAETVFQFAAPNLNVPDDPHVKGLRLSFLHGRNESMSGLDLGLLSVSETSRMSGAAFVVGMSRVTEEMSSGVALSLLNFHTGRDRGVNAAFVNLLGDAGGAVNTGFITIARGATLVDLGGINVSARSTAQIGFVNITKEIESFQLGFLNMAENGFLPVFPIFNFPKKR